MPSCGGVSLHGVGAGARKATPERGGAQTFANHSERRNVNETAPNVEAAETWKRIGERSQAVMQAFARRLGEDSPAAADPLGIAGAFIDLTRRMMADPARLAEAQTELWNGHMRLWRQAADRMMGGEAEPVVRPERGDRRFRDPAWQDNALFDYIKQSYLLTAGWMRKTVAETGGLDKQAARKAEFYTRQFADAIAPTNFAATNPEVLRETLATGGENLVRGLDNLLRDLEAGGGDLKIAMTDTNAFALGRDVATAPGQAIFRNDLIELIQYDPATERAHRRPLLIVPPWINKYYILDLAPENSFVRWAVGQGYTVFMISWVNPDERLAHKTFDDYMLEGPIAALDAIERATGEREAAAAGLCLGGTLLACTLGWLAARGGADRITSATFMNSLADFSEPGDLGVFIDDEQIAALEERMERAGGYLDAEDMAATFNMLRANDLIWSFVVHNYLMGKAPVPFDLLYWNADSTRMPARMHSFYLRKMYRENLLAAPGGITLAGEAIDLSRVKIPVYILASREDHIAPWKSCYASTQLYGGPVRFVLAGSGHVAGVTNSPQTARYPHMTNDADGAQPADPEKWLAGAAAREGSWWPDWNEWQSARAGGEVPARKPGDGALKPLAPAPGTYVRARAS